MYGRVVFNNGDDRKAIEAFLYQVEKLKRNGVTEAELESVTSLATYHIWSLNTYLEESSHGIECTTAPKDIETAMQLMYMKFMKPRFDQSEFDVAMNLIRSYLPNMMSMPNMQFNKHAVLAMHEDDPRNIFVSEETVAKASIENYRKEEHTEQVYMQHTIVSLWAVAI